MTEFALILPVFMFIVLGLLAFGRVFWYWIDANHLANETARWAVVDRNPYAPNGETLQQHVRDSSTVEFHNGVKVCIDFPDGAPNVGDRVRVRIQKQLSAVPAARYRADRRQRLGDDEDRALRRRRRPRRRRTKVLRTGEDVGTCS